MCEGGTNFGRGNGTTVPCDEAPVVFYGGPTPTWLSAFSADVAWRSLRLAGVAEFQGGHWVSEGNVGGSHVFFNNSKAAVEQTDPILVARQTMGDFGATGDHESRLREAPKRLADVHAADSVAHVRCARPAHR